LLVSAGALGDPRADYYLHCGGCHLPNGAGNPPEVPTLVDELGRLVDIAAGRDYIARVPGASQAPLSDERLAAVINWVLSEFNDRTLSRDFEPLTAEEVGRSRRNILADPLRYRAAVWPELEGPKTEGPKAEGLEAGERNTEGRAPAVPNPDYQP
jgi:hypothetical protein